MLTHCQVFSRLEKYCVILPTGFTTLSVWREVCNAICDWVFIGGMADVHQCTRNKVIKHEAFWHYFTGFQFLV